MLKTEVLSIKDAAETDNTNIHALAGRLIDRDEYLHSTQLQLRASGKLSKIFYR